jgi:oxygen-independent coproporphyrinogen-3 oxidase
MVLPARLLTDRLIKLFNAPGPYYTSYPILSEWTDAVGEDGYRRSLEASITKSPGTPTGLYIHFPFCKTQCYYCICNSLITRDRERIRTYLRYLCQEIDTLFEFFTKNDSSLPIREIHLGGGSPSYMAPDEFDGLMDKLRENISLAGLYDFSMEVDPRTTSIESLLHYADCGVTRLSFGVQDFDATVQKAINRIQPFETVAALLTPEIRRRFSSINFDILYGLPLQTKESFRQTIEQVKTLSPDRITLLKYAHVPESRRHQKALDSLPRPSERELAHLFFTAMEQFCSAGWEHIGIDHFAKSTDPLAISQRKGHMKRSFIGFTPGFTEELLGLGPTSTIRLGDSYFQNLYALEDYYQAIDSGRFPIYRGYRLGLDELLRREVINSILCTYQVDFEAIEEKYRIAFTTYFHDALPSLSEFTNLGMMEITAKGLTILPIGRYFLRNICRQFDARLNQKEVYRISGP